MESLSGTVENVFSDNGDERLYKKFGENDGSTVKALCKEEKTNTLSDEEAHREDQTLVTNKEGLKREFSERSDGKNETVNCSHDNALSVLLHDRKDKKTKTCYYSSEVSKDEDKKGDNESKFADRGGSAEAFSLGFGLLKDFTIPLENRKFQCELCGKGFPRRGLLENHRVVHTREQNFCCDMCDKKFSRKSTLVRHKVVHTGIKKYDCPVCGKDFFRKAHMIEHTLIHSGVKNYICELCGKGFSLRSHLTSHMFSHTQIKRFSCEVCQKGFCMKSGLVKHRLVHTGEKKYKCNLCEKYFSQSSVLTKHMLIHTGEKKFGCDVCGKMFSQKSQVTIHMRVHTKEKNFICNICGEGFSLKSNLERHKIVHGGERKHKCHICQKVFSQKAHLKGHMIVHSDKRDFSCPVCGKKYLRHASFKKHIQENHLDGSRLESIFFITDDAATTSTIKVECQDSEFEMDVSQSSDFNLKLIPKSMIKNSGSNVESEVIKVKEEKCFTFEVKGETDITSGEIR